jgi:hypothetical protein
MILLIIDGTEEATITAEQKYIARILRTRLVDSKKQGYLCLLLPSLTHTLLHIPLSRMIPLSR